MIKKPKMGKMKLYIAEYDIEEKGKSVDYGYFLEIAQNSEQAEKKIRAHLQDSSALYLDPEQGGDPKNLDFICITEINDMFKSQKGLIDSEYLIKVVKARHSNIGF